MRNPHILTLVHVSTRAQSSTAMKAAERISGHVNEYQVHLNNTAQKHVNLETGDLLLICTTVATDGMVYQGQVFSL